MWARHMDRRTGGSCLTLLPTFAILDRVYVHFIAETIMERKIARDVFTRFLKEGKYRITPERFVVLEAALSSEGHFDADTLYLKLRTDGANISRATVYKTLDLLLKSGLISKYQFDDGHSRYERAFGRPQHHHLICVSCGDIIEFTNTKLGKIRNEVCQENHFKPQTSTYQVFGLCQKCQNESASKF
ncbi:MAG: transcriptional repressor [Ignavibacteriales bacterium CG07_land_8_20_14_0_80_59_12]|nr:MAG: transcriptional repressor [Ignavibacteriales bacterium CG07_land_8_20_14_0_80_59_12]